MKFSLDTQQVIIKQVEDVLVDLDVQYGIELRKVKFIDDVCYVWVDMMESASTTIQGRHANHYVMVDYIVSRVQPLLDNIARTARVPIIPWKLQTSVYRGVFTTLSVDQVVNQPQDAGNHCPAWTNEEGELVEP